MALRTPLYDRHAKLGATFTEFAGYDMPVVYGSINDEHRTVREAVGLFDVSHMSNLWIKGSGAAATISAVCPFDASTLADGRGKYSVLLRHDGTILDDIFVFRVGEKFHMVPNAGMNEAAAQHLQAHAIGDVTIDDFSAETAILALQGPHARTVLAAVTDDPLPKFHRIVHAHIAGVHVGISGTGYTGEKGVEIFAPGNEVGTVWDALMDAGAEHGIQAVGLGARDTLRLEKGYALAGNEFAGGRTPLEAGLGWLIDWDQDFVGKSALTAQKAGEHDHLVGLVQEKGVPRQGYPVCKDGAPIGVISSGTKSPTTGQGIALAYVRGAAVGDAVTVEVRGRHQDATLVKPPFV